MINDYEVKGDTTVIFINSKKYGLHEVLVDTNCLELISDTVGSLYVNCSTRDKMKYAAGQLKGDYKNKILLHRFLTDAPNGKVVDHINHNTLDNRLSNLRVVSNSGNSQNRRAATRKSISRIRNVYRDNKKPGCWYVQMTVAGKSMYFGSFTDIEEAKAVAEDARKRYMPFSIEHRAPKTAYNLEDSTQGNRMLTWM